MLGVFVRIALAPFTTTGDVVFFELRAHERVDGDFSNFLGSVVGRERILGVGWIWVSSGMYKLWRIFFGTVRIDAFHDYGLIFLMKAPLLIFDIILAFLIYKFACKIGINASNAFSMWMLNPFVIFVDAVWGQIDVIPLFFTISCLILLLSERHALAFMSLGVGIAFKSWPVIVLPIFLIVLYRKKGLLRATYLGILTFIPTFLLSLPFLGGFWDLTRNYVQGHAHSPIINAFIFTIRLGTIPIAPVLMTMFLLLFFIQSKSWVSNRNLYKAALSILIIPFTVSILNPSFFSLFSSSSFLPSSTIFLFHPYWLIWLVPFLTVYMIDSAHSRILFILLMLTGFSYMFSQFYAPIYFLSPVIEGVWTAERFVGDPQAWYIWPAYKIFAFRLIAFVSRIAIPTILIIYEIKLTKEVFPRFWIIVRVAIYSRIKRALQGRFQLNVKCYAREFSKSRRYERRPIVSF